jgi:hypothetical protein
MFFYQRKDSLKLDTRLYLWGVCLQNLWRDLYLRAGAHNPSLESDAELRLTGLMTSPSTEIAKTKLGQYLQDANQLREKNQIPAALVVVLVSAEYYWRKHHPNRAAGLLIEACDLFSLIQDLEASQKCLDTALELLLTKPALAWWESELLGDLFLFLVCVALLDDSSTISQRLTDFRNRLSEKLQSQISREDGYRVATALRRAIQRKSSAPLDELDSKTTLRTQSKHTTLHEHLLGLANRYSLIQEGLTALQKNIPQENP